MAMQCKTCLTTGENCHGFTSLVYPQCGGHNRELLIKSLNYCCPQGWGRVVSTDDCYIKNTCFQHIQNKNVDIRMCKRAVWSASMFPPLGYVL